MLKNQEIQRFVIFFMVSVIMLHLNDIKIMAQESSEIVNNGTYSITNVKTGNELYLYNDENVDTMVSGKMAGNFSMEQKFRFVYDHDQDAYRIYVISDSGCDGKVLDIVKSDGRIIAGCKVQTYNPVDDETQLWCIISNPDGTYTIRSKYNQEVILATGNAMYAEVGVETSATIGNNVFVTTLESENAAEGRWILSLNAEPLLTDPYDCLWRYMFRNPYMARNISQKYSYSHYGVDITLAGGDISGYPVYSVSTGTVLYANFSTSAGYYAAIKMNDGYTVRYLHLREQPLVSINQVVTGSNQIGYVGNTGQSTGPHLHFDVNTVGAISGGSGSSNVNYGTTVDPLEFYSDYAFTY